MYQPIVSYNLNDLQLEFGNPAQTNKYKFNFDYFTVFVLDHFLSTFSVFCQLFLVFFPVSSDQYSLKLMMIVKII